jgi:hypothetical protein
MFIAASCPQVSIPRQAYIKDPAAGQRLERGISALRSRGITRIDDRLQGCQNTLYFETGLILIILRKRRVLKYQI